MKKRIFFLTLLYLTACLSGAALAWVDKTNQQPPAVEQSPTQFEPERRIAFTATPTLAPTRTPRRTATATRPPRSTATSTPTPYPVVIVEAENCNLRTGPGAQYPVSGYAYQGDIFRLYGQNEAGTWLQIDLQGKVWIKASLVKKTFATPTARP